MEKVGWVKLHRKILDWEWYDNTNTRLLFLHMLLHANTKDTEWHGHKIPKGAFISSMEKLAEGAGLSVRSTRTALTKLKSTNEVTIKTTPQFSLVKLNNWASYQVGDEQIDKRPTNDRQQYKNKKNKENTEGEIISSLEETLMATAGCLRSDDAMWADVAFKMHLKGYKPFIQGDSAKFQDGSWVVMGASGWVSVGVSVRENIVFRHLDASKPTFSPVLRFD